MTDLEGYGYNLKLTESYTLNKLLHKNFQERFPDAITQGKFLREKFPEVIANLIEEYAYKRRGLMPLRMENRFYLGYGVDYDVEKYEALCPLQIYFDVGWQYMRCQRPVLDDYVKN